VGCDIAYLDCAASTPVRPSVVEAMLPFLTEHYGNPSGGHWMARVSRKAIDDVRETTAEVLGFGPHDIIFTSGGTEADNLAVAGTVGEGIAVCGATEHHAVLNSVEYVGGRFVRVDRRGLLDLDHLTDVLDESVTVVSVMLVNNESGVVNDLEAIASVVRHHAPAACLHTDAVQALTWLDVAEAAQWVDALSLSGHKFGAPKGVGLLAVRPSVGLSPTLLGGGQEADRRSGTHNTPGIVAMGEALSCAVGERGDLGPRLRLLRDRLADGIAVAGGVHETTSREDRTAGMLQVVVDGVASEALLVLLEQGGVMASAAASCASGALDPSHVLAAMGFDRVAAAGSLRLSLGWCTTADEIDLAIEVIPPAIAQLREQPRSAGS